MTAHAEYRSKLDACLDRARTTKPSVPPGIGSRVDRLVEGGDRAIISAALASLLEKAVDPGRDVRKRQVKMSGGYACRTLVQEVATQFLQENSFPAVAEGGRLARPPEQSAEHALGHPGAIKKCKKELLLALDAVERGDVDATALIVYFLQRLSGGQERRGMHLASPSGLTVQEVAEILEEHFSAQYGARGAARLPALAVHAAYRQMTEEVGRYKDCTLGGLVPRASADRRAGPLGDVEVRSGSRGVFEAVEVRHDQPATARMVRAAFDKFKSLRNLDRYYILTARRGGGADDSEAVTRAVVEVSREHECQVIVNGVIEGLKYYLRLLRSTDEFVQNYVALLRDDPAIEREHREMWNRIVGRKRAS